jgi:hypothetical protein
MTKLMNWKRFSVLLLIGNTVMLAYVFHIGGKLGLQRLETRSAYQAVMDYDRVRNQLSTMAVDFEAAMLHNITGQNLNSSDVYLRKILERERSRVIQDFIEDLRKKTGEDLGSDPDNWIRKYE